MPGYSSVPLHTSPSRPASRARLLSSRSLSPQPMSIHVLSEPETARSSPRNDEEVAAVEAQPQPAGRMLTLQSLSPMLFPPTPATVRVARTVPLPPPPHHRLRTNIAHRKTKLMFSTSKHRTIPVVLFQ